MRDIARTIRDLCNGPFRRADAPRFLRDFPFVTISALISNPRARRWLCGLMLAPLLLGCSAGKDQNRELVENELRLLEDEIYSLEADLGERDRILDACRRENDALKRELQSVPGGNAARGSEFNNPLSKPGGNGKAAPRNPANEQATEPIIEAPPLPGGAAAPNTNQRQSAPPPAGGARPNLNEGGARKIPADDDPPPPAPRILPGNSSVDPRAGRTPSPYRRAAYDGPLLISGQTGADEPLTGQSVVTEPTLAAPEISKPEVAASSSVPNPSGQVGEPRGDFVARLNSNAGAAITAPISAAHHIALHPRLTGGQNIDRRQGDEGILVVVQPQNEQNQNLNVPGSIAVALVDPTLNARTARWEFQTDEAAKHWKHTLIGGEAYHLELRWPNQPPQNALQDLYVRFTLGDGRTLETRQRVKLDLPRETSPQDNSSDDESSTGRETQSDAAGGWRSPATELRLSTNDPAESAPPAWGEMSLEPTPQLAPAQQPPQAQSDQRRVPLAERLAERRAATGARRGAAPLPHDAAAALGAANQEALSPTVESPPLPGAVPGNPFSGANPPRTSSASGASDWSLRSLFSPSANGSAPTLTPAPPAVPHRPDGFVIVPLNPRASGGNGPDAPQSGANSPGMSPRSAANPGVAPRPATPAANTVLPAARTPQERPTWRAYR